MDVKIALAKGIQNQLVNGGIPLDKSDKIEALEFGGAKIEASAVTPLVTQIRVVTLNQGVRYFTVRVQEHL